MTISLLRALGLEIHRWKGITLISSPCDTERGTKKEQLRQHKRIWPTEFVRRRHSGYPNVGAPALKTKSVYPLKVCILKKMSGEKMYKNPVYKVADSYSS